MRITPIATILAITITASTSTSWAMRQCSARCSCRLQIFQQFQINCIICNERIYAGDCAHDELFRCRECLHRKPNLQRETSEPYIRDDIYKRYSTVVNRPGKIIYIPPGDPLAKYWAYQCHACKKWWRDSEAPGTSKERLCDQCKDRYSANLNVYRAWQKAFEQNKPLIDAIHQRASTLGIRRPAPGFLDDMLDGSLGLLFVQERRKQTTGTQTE